MIINCIPTDPTSRIAPQDYYHQLTNTPSIDPLRDTYLQCLFGTAAIISNHPGLSMFGDLRTRNAKEDFKLLGVAVNSFTLIASNLDSPTNLFTHYMSISNASSLVNGAHHPDLAFNIIATFTR